ncbi:hypothetical protein [Gordonia insulae]|uniref:hypothetical protein n=1 Tax=Gordonia insulae TaxID=2420509 RepID=UPI001E5F8D0D|nr:hypothetical protein [Gordonia insulae]
MARRRADGVRAAASAVLLCLLAAISAGCASTVDGAGGAAPGEVAAYRSEVSAAAASSIRRDGVALCREAMSSMVVMVRGYNAFVDRLSTVHAYDRVGDLDDRARASLIAGADLIRKRITPLTPADVADPANRFLDSTGRLGAAIAARQLTGLNPIAAQWTRDKQAVLTNCSSYLPLPPTAGASPAPDPRATSSAPSPSSSVPPTP